jgi:hypothetical protein
VLKRGADRLAGRDIIEPREHWFGRTAFHASFGFPTHLDIRIPQHFLMVETAAGQQQSSIWVERKRGDRDGALPLPQRPEVADVPHSHPAIATTRHKGSAIGTEGN